ncbi:SUKH-4 family immunity protein [Streptomyces chattanoogensis]|uniref:SUKH-4 family immunity protein n=1 Tax=Streptomyces chattanoogensis TaxID=66876 RepID=UPI00099D345A|nr:SUKH-4 family immunity protein [Streptomyces chattanoogensis]
MAGAGGFQTDVESLKTEGTNFVKLGDDFSDSVSRLVNGLAKLRAGEPTDDVKKKQKQPEEKSFGEQFWHVDCHGRTAHEVMKEVARRAAENPGATSTIYLDNARWAGPFLTSSEPERINTSVRTQLMHDFGVAVELTPHSDPDNYIPPLQQILHSSPFPREETKKILAGLGALEQRSTPTSVWMTVVRALAGRSFHENDLLQIAESWRQILTIERGHHGNAVRCVDDSAHQAIRKEFPLSRREQSAVVRELWELWPQAGQQSENHPVQTYVTHTLPLHAALAGRLEEFLSDAKFIAHAHWYSMLQALHLAYPHGVPPEGIAADIHYLHVQGVQPATQAEWISWLHHAALSRDDTALATSLLREAGELPWRTVWSHWRLPGHGGSGVPDSGNVENLRAASHGESWAVTTWRETNSSGLDGEPYECRVWDAWTGRLLDDPRLLEQDIPVKSAGSPFPGVRYAININGWKSRGEQCPQVPRAPRAIHDAVRLGEAEQNSGSALWVFAGLGGLFAALVNEKATENLPGEPWDELFVPGPLTQVAPRPLPWPLPSTDPLSREWLEHRGAFRSSACRPIPENAVPSSIQDQGTRRFLTQIGWPVSHGIGGLHSTDLSTDGLRLIEEGSTLLSGLGQLGSLQILLDGATGKVFIANHDRSEIHLAGSSIEQFLILLILHHTALCSDLVAGQYEMFDLAESFKEWCHTVDPGAAGEPFWESQFAGFDSLSEDYDLMLEEIEAE